MFIAFRPSVVSLVLLGALPLCSFADDSASFFRGLNLNGPPVVIDGNAWEGSDSKSYVCSDRSFENQQVTLVPATDAERAKMIRSSRYGGNRIELLEIPAGTYTLFLYVWEDNNAETYSVSIGGRKVIERYNSGMAGHWEKLGPWPVKVQQTGSVVITSQGGAANFSGVELWHGDYDGLGGEIPEASLAFFEKRIRPLLVDKCYDCHSADASEAEGGLLVDSRATLRRGGSKGPAIIAGDASRSLLIEAVRYQNDKMRMPPDEKLSDDEIADLERWINEGALDPRSKATKHLGKPIDLVAAKQFWSLRPLERPQVPQLKNDQGVRNDLDRFIRAKLEELQLAPASDAEKRVLIRRATFDLIGLPPTVDEVNAFLADDSDKAFARVVDRLLQSPKYGERWGRHWLDVVRYADTAGDNSDYPIPQIYRYRDWVIDAFNRDLPYDEFVRDQIAGDLRGGVSEEERQSRLIATGYLANSRRFGSRVDDYPQHLTIEDTIDNLGRSFLGMTLSCARCHDHKFDPISNRDYYGLYGIFHSTRYPWPGIELDKKQRDFVPLVAAEQPSLFETAYAVIDAKEQADVAIQIKGDPARLGDVVPRKFLTVLGGQELPGDFKGSGRAELAEWILAEDNPLPARVMVNRIWLHHFGRGLVPTPNDFGQQGKPPTHPELLDYLATEFRRNDWSIKSMHRLIMLSSTYQQSSVRSSKSLAKDPTNDGLSSFPRRRLDAESLRDSLLFLADNLDLSPAGPHPFPEPKTWDFTQHKPFKAVYETNHRSVYLMTQRIQRHPFLAIFDGADPSTSTAARMTSTTPLQALYLLNDPLVHEQTRRIADVIVDHADDDTSRIQFAYERMFSRPALFDEVESALTFLDDARELLGSQAEPTEQVDREAWAACVRSLIRLNEFVYLD